MKEQNNKNDQIHNHDFHVLGLNEFHHMKVDLSKHENHNESFFSATDQDEEFRKLIKEKASRHSVNSALVDNIMRKLKGY